MTVSVSYAAEHLDELLTALDRGEAVRIERPDKPTLELASAPVSAVSNPTRPRVLGQGKAIVNLPSEEELERIDREWKLGFIDGPVFPPDAP
jgi:hypothetical protein